MSDERVRIIKSYASQLNKKMNADRPDVSDVAGREKATDAIWQEILKTCKGDETLAREVFLAMSGRK